MRTAVVSVAVSFAALLVAGCGSLRPDAMTMEENVQRAQADRKKIEQASKFKLLRSAFPKALLPLRVVVSSHSLGLAYTAIAAMPR